MSHLFLETFYPAIVAAIAAVILWIAGNKRVRADLKNAGLGLLGLALLLAALSYWAVTDREQVTANTRALVAAIQARDWNAMRSHLDPAVQIGQWTGPDDIIAGGRQATDRYGLKNARILSMEVTAEKPDIYANFAAKSEHEGAFAGFPMTSKWRLRWVRVNDRWLIRDIEPLEVMGVPMESVTAIFQNRPQ